MSLIYTGHDGARYGDVYCEICGEWCFREEWAVICDMALRDIRVLCWLCDLEDSDVLPSQIYYLDETYLLGIGDKSFLMTWLTDDLEIRQEDLRAVRIGCATWYDLKTGGVALLTKRNSRAVVGGG